MSMKMKLAIALSALALTAPLRAATEPQLLTTVEEYPTGFIDRVEQHGQSPSQNVRFSVVADKHAEDGRATSVLVTINGAARPLVRIDNSRFPGLDLSSLEVFVKRRGEQVVLKINARYGEARDECFLNDDGRNVAIMMFYTDRPSELHSVTYDNCEPDVHQVTD